MSFLELIFSVGRNIFAYFSPNNKMSIFLDLLSIFLVIGYLLVDLGFGEVKTNTTYSTAFCLSDHVLLRFVHPLFIVYFFKYVDHFVIKLFIHTFRVVIMLLRINLVHQPVQKLHDRTIISTIFTIFEDDLTFE